MKIGLSTKQKRCFFTALSGLTLAELRGNDVRFLTLTTSFDGSNRDIANDWIILDKRIQRKFGFKPEYIRVKTNEGNGVLHILYKGKYIPQRWISNAWNDIHKSKVVSIEWVRNSKQMAGYMSQYISDQNSSYQRYSTSNNWIAPGYAKIRDVLKKSSRDYSNTTWMPTSADDGYWSFSFNFDKFICSWRRYLYSLYSDSVPNCCWISDGYRYNYSDYIDFGSTSCFCGVQTSLSDFG